ncbi:hypothetical protein PVK06_032183 [Gossypium arboreum]|uniref:ADF-H domain-containing protein n=11 Tax=Gossypium TaxID=3633 RepID=A0ABR0NU49_GOSAR|nr:hypothetical protein PVK06_032183 [Gossypium arboreum]
MNSHAGHRRSKTIRSATGLRSTSVSKHAGLAENASASYPIPSLKSRFTQMFAPLSATIADPTSPTFTSISPREKVFSFRNYVRHKEQIHKENWLRSEALANAASGMAVDDECKLKFLELKAKRNYRFIVFKIQEQQVVVEKVGSPQETYEDFTAALPADECRYAVFDFDFTTDENCQKSKIFFIAWSPDTSRVRSKMVYASSKDRFKRELDGIQVELQATDPSEMSFDIIKARAI